MKGSVFFTLRSRNRLLKTLRSVRVTLLCGLLTFIVLRSSLGAGKFGTPAKDYEEILYQLHSLKLRHQQKLLLRKELTQPALHKDASRSTLSLPLDIAVVRSSESDNAGPGRKFDSNHRPHILLITGSDACEGAIEAQFLLMSLKNKMDYCRLHGIEIFYDARTTGIATRSRFLQELMLSHPQVEWIWWMDSLAAFTDMSSHLTFERYAGHNVVEHGREGNFSAKDGWDRLWEGGSFLLRNCEWSQNYLANGGQMQAMDVYVDTRVETYEPGVGDGAAWPFITHFGSCSVCGKGNIDPSCLTHMERAFNYADNQMKNVGTL